MELAVASGPRAKADFAVPWFVWVAVLAITSTVIGVQWDIAWHRSIGRDTFWSPPHLAIYLGGVLAAVASGYLILGTTFARSAAAGEARTAAVCIWGFHGPLGAFIAAWGGIAMLASAPFDDWWHNTYGLDVKILSPPHTVLALGLVGIQLGTLILLAGMMNRASGRQQSLLRALFLYTGGFILVGVMTFEMEFTNRTLQHSGTFYRAVMSGAPLILLGVGYASGQRFGTTAAAGVYSAVMLILLWVLPLVPATPKLGPVYYQVTHLVPGGFPLLLIAPALAVDLGRQWLDERRQSPGRQALLLGVLFLAVFLAVQWTFAELLLSPYSHNWIFGSHYFGYSSRRYFHDVNNLFFDRDGSPQAFRQQLGLAMVAAILTTRLGLAWGSGMRGLRR